MNRMFELITLSNLVDVVIVRKMMISVRDKHGAIRKGLLITAAVALVVLVTAGLGVAAWAVVTSNNAGKKSIVSSAKPKKASPPLLAIDSPQSNIEVTQTKIDVSGKTEPGCTVTVDGNKIDIEADGSFSFTYDLVRGINMITVESENKAGGHAQQEIVIDCNPPVVEDNESSISTGNISSAGSNWRDTSTPVLALLGHWKSDDEETEWYFNQNEFTTSDSEGTSVSGTYTVVSSDSEAFEVTISLLGVPVNIVFSDDRDSFTMVFSEDEEILFHYLDSKTEP